MLVVGGVVMVLKRETKTNEKKYSTTLRLFNKFLSTYLYTYTFILIINIKILSKTYNKNNHNINIKIIITTTTAIATHLQPTLIIIIIIIQTVFSIEHAEFYVSSGCWLCARCAILPNGNTLQ